MLSESLYSAIALLAADTLQRAMTRSTGPDSLPAKPRAHGCGGPAVGRGDPDSSRNDPVPPDCGSLAARTPAHYAGCRARGCRGRNRRPLDGTQRPRARTVHSGRVGGRHHLLDRQPSARPRRRRPRRQSGLEAGRARVPPRPRRVSPPKSSSRSTIAMLSRGSRRIRDAGSCCSHEKRSITVVPAGPSYTLHSTRYWAASAFSYLLLLPLAIVGIRRLWRSSRSPDRGAAARRLGGSGWLDLFSAGALSDSRD